LAIIPGFKWLTNKIPYENVVFIAIRDIDPDEWVNLKRLNIKCFTMDHVTQLGIGEVVRQAHAYLDPVGDKPFHISFDIDAIDPNIAFGTGTKFRGGLSPVESNYIVRATAHERNLVGLDVMEINRKLEQEEGRVAFRGEHGYGLVSPTVGLGLDLIDSIFTNYFTL
jgi:arginase